MSTIGNKQLSFLDDDVKEERQIRLESTIDDIRRRFGHFSIQRALMHTDKPLTDLNPKDDHVIFLVPFTVCEKKDADWNRLPSSSSSITGFQSLISQIEAHDILPVPELETANKLSCITYVCRKGGSRRENRRLPPFHIGIRINSIVLLIID